MTVTHFNLTQPDWAAEELEKMPAVMPTVEERMAAVIRFSRLNFERGTGGPFAAGVFERDTGKRVVISANRVVAHNCSSAHAEVMTLSLAQQILGTYDLGGPGMPAYQFVVNWRPCAMCFGATLWSGIRELVISGSGPELEAITGFDEGPVHPDWENELAKRGISLINNVLRDEAIAVYRDFAASQALVYNARQG
ncbi:MAG: nucleoside deaminase [Pleurocapsa minor GSE-CHR-MK-17-07R]|jgi:tRNA(Arg) A34 adenosine deaminase TadA|nr:nucleoside deaminase [Pleurocapsa minor GSE-CHR-MK 17-07R]